MRYDIKENMGKKLKIFKNWYVKDKTIITVSFLLGLIITLLFAIYSKNYSYKMQRNISKEVIRLHVLANSDLEKDQALKIKVRDSILEKYGPIMEKSQNIKETKKILEENLQNIENSAKETIIKEGFDYDVKVLIGNSNFPTKEYGNIRLPIGEYEAVKVIIGKGEGQNWWCVLFPPLCFVDVSRGTISEDMKKQLKNVLTKEEYKLIVNSDKDIVDIKFKIVEFWQKKHLNKKR